MDSVFKSKLLTLNFGHSFIKPLCRSTRSFFSLLSLQTNCLRPKAYINFISFADTIISLLDYEESERLLSGLDIDLTQMCLSDLKCIPMSTLDLEFAITVMTSSQLKALKFGEFWRIDQRLMKGLSVIETNYTLTNLQVLHLPPLGLSV